MISVDDAFQTVLATLPDDLRRFAEYLPYRIGVTRYPSARWDEFWVLDPNRHPIEYVLSVSEGDGLPVLDADCIDLFSAAHGCAVVHGLIFDRLADRQVAPDSELLALRRIFLDGWTERLTRASGDRANARTAIAGALGSLRRGTMLERSTAAARRLSPEEYAKQTRDKLRWCSATPTFVLRATGRDASAIAFERCYDHLGAAIQCLDDAIDSEEDAALRGISVPSALGIPDGALVVTAKELCIRGGALAATARLAKLTAWFDRFVRWLSAARPDGLPERNETLGRNLAEAMEEWL